MWWLWSSSAANRESNERTIPKPEEFSNALYILDIGQNDISAGFRPMSYDKFQAEIPDIINQLATVVQVSSLGRFENFAN